MPPAPTGAGASPYDAERIRAQLRVWKERLLDLSRANPLLGVNRSRVTKLRVRSPDGPALLERLAISGEKLDLPLVRKIPRRASGATVDEGAEAEPGTDWQVTPGDIDLEGTPDELARKIRRIYDNGRTTVEERGVTTLHLTIGVLEWDDPHLGESHTPIWMIPCRLERTSQLAPLRLEMADEEIRLNPALDLYLRERHRIQLPDVPEEITPAALAAHLETTAQRVREIRGKVTGAVWLSTFSFEALVLYQDLTAMAGLAVQNRLIAALARAGAEPEGSEALGEDLDATPTERTPVPVLATDSSQLEALIRASGGRHLVVHGPPGTGKSQTITALIADALGRGQKVLFVSAKMAALEVVYRRLQERGLADFCLEAHSTKAGKAHIIEELRRTLESDDATRDVRLAEEHEALTRVRAQLNAYVQALHERIGPLAFTPYRAIGRVAALRDAPEVQVPLPWESVLEVTRDQLADVVEALDDLGAQAELFDGRARHPWRGLESQRLNLAEQEALERGLRRVRASADAARGHATALALDHAVLSFQALDADAASFRAYAGVDALPAGWREGPAELLGRTADVLDAAAAAATDARERLAAHRRAMIVDPAEAVARLLPLRQRFRSRWARLLPGYWSWRRAVRGLLVPQTADTPLLDLLENAERYLERKRELAALAGTVAPVVGPASAEDPQALGAASSRYRAAALLRSARLSLTMLAEPTSSTRASALGMTSGIPSGSTELTEAVALLDGLWPQGLCLDGRRCAELPLAELVSRCDELLGARAKLGEWLALRRLIERCQSVGVGLVLDSLGTASAASARRAFERRFYTLWANAAIDRSPELESFLGSKRDDLVRRFRDLDGRIRISAARHIRAVAGEPARLIRRADPTLGNGSQVGILRKELQKRRRIKPLRKLFDEIPQVLQALKPCMLMSPVSVSTYLKPGTIEFDLVVFDEASQLPTPEAVPSILRSKQVVVAGDTRQLPPTTFFMSSLLSDEEEIEDEEQASLDPLDSLLDDAVAVVPHFDEAYLRWHYRSRDERLISFSNHYFYDGRLHTFPSATTASDGRGVELIYVPDGIYGRGKDRRNPREARVVAKTIVRELERHPERSIGVAAMSLSQREAIEDAIDEELAERPDLRAIWDRGGEEPNFVKALENVQGDERDTIIISIGYGKGADGSFALNFGPLNIPGGERRLNVLVTRAKWHTILVTSLRSSELAGVNPNNRGATALKNFIAYAETGGRIPHPPATVTEAESNDFEDAVRDALLRRGLSVDQQVGASRYRIDLAVRDRRDPSRYVLGVECDGATYHGTRTARDRDLVRHEVLRSMGWRIHRMWSTEWFRDPDAAIDAVLRSLEQAEAAPPERSVPAEQKFASLVIDSGLLQEKGTHPANHAEYTGQFAPGVGYRRYKGTSREEHQLTDGRYTDGLAARILQIAAVEAPILEQVLIERLREVYGVGQAGANIRRNIDKALRLLVRRRAIAVEDADGEKTITVVPVPGTPAPRFRTPGDGVRRRIEDIPRDEIAMAVLHLLETQFGMQRERIPSEVTQLFGFDRARGPSADRIAAVVDDLIDEGRLRASGPNVTIA